MSDGRPLQGSERLASHPVCDLNPGHIRSLQLWFVFTRHLEERARRIRQKLAATEPTVYDAVMMMRWSNAVLLLCIVLSLQAQTDADITGSVTDITNASLAEAHVHLTNGTGVKRDVRTNSDGIFVIRDLTPDTYDLTVTLAGFAPFWKSGILLEAGKLTSVNVQLQVLEPPPGCYRPPLGIDGSPNQWPGISFPAPRSLPPFPLPPPGALSLVTTSLGALSQQVFATQSGLRDRMRLVIRDRSRWEVLWATLTAHNSEKVPTEPVDFRRKMIVLAAMGTRPNDGFQIQIGGVYRRKKDLYVTVLETTYMYGCGITPDVIAPVAAVLVPRSKSPVHFLEGAADWSCQCPEPVTQDDQ